MLGNTTASFDHRGQVISTESLVSASVELRYPRFEMPQPMRVGKGLGKEASVGGEVRYYSASFSPTASQQDYDLQTLISSSNKNLDIGNKKIVIRDMYYRTPRSMWRFFAYYGALNVIGNLHDYGQYSDESSYEVVPAWQNKLQAMAYEDSLYTRISHYSYDIVNNRLRLFPTPGTHSPDKFFLRFYIPQDAWVEEDDRQRGGRGVNNMNTLPFANIPYNNINAIGKQWVRRYTLALVKETLGLVRSRFGTIPIPGDSVTQNGAELISSAKEEQKALRDELKEILDELTYSKITETNADMADKTKDALRAAPLPIFVG